MVVAIKGAFALPNLSISRTATPVLSQETPITTPVTEQPAGRSLSRPPSPEPTKHGLFKRSISGGGRSRTSTESDVSGASVRSRSVAPLLGRLSGATSFHSSATTPATTSSAQSKATSPSSTPAIAQNGQTPVLPQTLEASYVSKASIRLGELVNRIFASTGPAGTNAASAAAGVGAAVHGEALVVYNGRPAPRVPLAKEMGKVIAEQLLSSVGDPYLLRTILRSSILRAVSVFHSRLEQALVAPLKEPQSVATPRSVRDADLPPACQRYNLEVLKCVWEVRRGLDRACHGVNPATGEESAEMPHFVLEALKPWREKMTIVIKRIICPILDEAKKVVSSKVKEAVQAGANQSTVLANGIQSGTTAKTLGGKTTTATASQPVVAAASGVIPHPASSPAYRELANTLDGLQRMVARLDCGQDAHRWVVAIATSLIWKGMLAFSIRQGGSKEALRPSTAGSSTSNGTETSQPRTPSPPHGHPALPSIASPPVRSKSLFRRDVNGKRSPSPPPGSTSAASVAQGHLESRLLEEVEAFEAMVRKFVGDLSKEVPIAPGAATLNCPLGTSCDLCKTGRGAGLREDDDDEDTEPEDDVALANEAMVEALQALSAMAVVLRACNRPHLIGQTMNIVTPLTPSAALGVSTSIAGNAAATNSTAGSLRCITLARAITTMPTIILLHIVTVRTPGCPPPHEAMETDWPTYEASLRGFAAAEDIGEDVAFELAQDVEDVPASEWKTVLELVLKVKAGVQVAMPVGQH